MNAIRLLLSCSIYDAYLDNMRFTSAHFEPDAASQKVLNRAGLLARSLGGSVEVYVDESRLDDLKVMQMDESLVLAWRMRSSDRSLGGYTSPQLMQPGKVLFVELEEGRYPDEHDSNFVGEADFTNLSDSELPSLLVLRDHGDLDALDKLVEMFGVSLAQLLTLQDLLLPPLAFIVMPHDVYTPRQHRIRLDSLRSYWRYRVFGGHHELNMNVVDPTGDIKFTSLGIEEFPGPGGRLIETFESDKSFPLRAQGPRLELRSDSTSKRAALVPYLPTATAANTRLGLINGSEEYVSDIFFTL